MNEDPTAENEAIEKVVERLSERFPEVERGRIDEVVHDEHHEFDGRPIREYVPVLVEHGAKQRLREEF
ncbi:MAG: hypothetical protein JWQ47_2981 [Glaciihabitans sp.]|nr:hypothetical protein [Glaciihabitans sp.]MDQ1588557.1 hypothetical protein [Microbacteriaceae bacterium]